MISYLILWVVVVLGGLVLLALAREMEALHKKLETRENYFQATGDKNGK